MYTIHGKIFIKTECRSDVARYRRSRKIHQCEIHSDLQNKYIYTVRYSLYRFLILLRPERYMLMMLYGCSTCLFYKLDLRCSNTTHRTDLYLITLMLIKSE